jgi:biopolymer transport protein ExbD
MREISTMRKISNLAAMMTVVVFLSCSGGSDQNSQDERSEVESQAQSSSPTVVLSIDGDDAITVDGNPCDIADLSQTLVKAAEEDPQNAVIRIVAADSVEVGILDEIEKQLRAAKLMRVVYAKGKDEGFPLILPPSEYDQQMLQQIQGNLVTVRIEPTGAILLNEETVALGDLQSEIQALLAKNEHLVVSVKTGVGTTYGSLIDVLGQLEAGGANRITVNDPNL